MVMIAPAPVLRLAVARPSAITPRAAVAAAARIGGLALGTSAWWLAMQIQGRHGADLLAYSESLEDVSLDRHVERGLAVPRLADVRPRSLCPDDGGADYMADLVPIVCGFVLAVALIGLAVSAPRTALRHRHDLHRARPRRRLRFVQQSALIAPAVPRRRTGRTLVSAALEHRALPCWRSGWPSEPPPSSTRSGAAAWRRITLAATVVVVAVGNLPVLIGADLVDPALERRRRPKRGPRQRRPSTSWCPAPRPATARGRVRGVHVGLHRRSTAARLTNRW